jgi:hypothetical protein
MMTTFGASARNGDVFVRHRWVDCASVRPATLAVGVFAKGSCRGSGLAGASALRLAARDAGASGGEAMALVREFLVIGVTGGLAAVRCAARSLELRRPLAELMDQSRKSASLLPVFAVNSPVPQGAIDVIVTREFDA